MGTEALSSHTGVEDQSTTSVSTLYVDRYNQVDYSKTRRDRECMDGVTKTVLERNNSRCLGWRANNSNDGRERRGRLESRRQ